MSHYETGVRGENEAEAYLTGLGMRCLHRRWRGEDGEIDLVMEDAGTIVFVEVKLRLRGFAGDGFRAVTPAKQRRIAHAAMAYLVQFGHTDHPVRFDAVEITMQGIRHIPNAFQPSYR